jgi:chorismate synthase
VRFDPVGLTFDQIKKEAAESPMHCANKAATKKMMSRVDEARRSKDTVGGIFEVIVRGAPVGLGSFVHYDRRLSAKLAASLLSIQAVKGVEIGIGFKVSENLGKDVHDEIFYDSKRGYHRKTNRAGGIEGGMSNGCDLVVRAAMKPISTLGQPLASVNMKTKQPEKADFERADICAVPAGSVIGESLVAFVIADAFLEKFGGDSMLEIERNYKGYLKQLANS